MIVEGYTLDGTLIQKWIDHNEEEYLDYLSWAYDEETGTWSELPDWMLNGDPADGPFDLLLDASEEWHDE